MNASPLNYGLARPRVFIGYLVFALFISLAFSKVAAAELTAIEITRLEGDHFYNQLCRALCRAPSQPHSVLLDLRALLQRFDSEVQRTGMNNSADSAFHALAINLSVIGDESDFQSLLRIWERDKWPLPMSPLLDFAIRLEIDKIASSKPLPKVSIPEYAGPVPANLTNASARLITAWRKVQALHNISVEIFSLTNQPWIEINSGNWKNFCNDVSPLLHGRTNALQTIVAYRWAAGTRSELFAEPRAQALLLGHLRQKNFIPALSLVFQVTGARRWGMWSIGSLQGDDAWQRNLITACGLDWEELYVGTLLSNVISGAVPERGPVLARHGSGKAAEYLIDVADLPSFRGDREILETISILVEPAPGNDEPGGRESLLRYQRISRAKIPDPLQQKFLGILFDQLRPEAGPDAGLAACDALGRLLRPESKDALRRALESPYNDVRQSASRALTAMSDEELPPPQLLPTVQFHFRTNGIPAMNFDIGWTLSGPDGRIVSSHVRTDVDGLFSLERDSFNDPQHSVTNIEFEPHRYSAPSKPAELCWFRIDVPAPAASSNIPDVDVSLATLTLQLHLPRPGDIFKDQDLRISLQNETNEVLGSIGTHVARIPVVEIVNFQALQVGRKYTVKLLCHGAAIWESEPTLLKKEGIVLPVHLQPGSDVISTVFLPGAQNPDREIVPRLFRLERDKEVEEFQDPWIRRWFSLRVGNYRLHIPSTREAEAMRDKNQIVTPKPPYLGTNLFFTIESTSPPVIELPFHLEAAGK